MNKILLCVSVCTFAVFLIAPSAQAAINEQLRFYGTLQDTAGVDLEGTFDMVFRFYDAASGGTLLDTSTHTAANGNAVTVSAGEFSTLLGSGTGNTLDGLDFDTAAIYVGLTIGTDSEMTPREQLAAAAYAFNADAVDGYDANQLLRYNATGSIAVTDASTLLTLTQSGVGDILNLFDGVTEVFSVLDGGNVGIGTTSPIRTLSVAGDVIVTGGLYDNSNSAGVNGYVLQSTGSGFGWVATSTLGIGGGGGSSLFTDGGATTYLTAIGDNLGVGTTTATEKLTVAGNINLDGNFGLAINGIEYFGADTADRNIRIGEEAGELFTTGLIRNVAIGYQAMQNASTSLSDHNVAIGYRAGHSNDDRWNNMIGYRAGENNSGEHNLLFGYDAGRNNFGNQNLLFGIGAGSDNTGGSLVGIGSYALGSSAGIRTIGIGIETARYNTGSENSMLGWRAGWFNTGSGNLIFGGAAGSGNTGDQNVLIGTDVGSSNTGDENVFIGSYAHRFNDSSSTVAIGAYALRGFVAGNGQSNNNTAVGYFAGENAAANSHNNILLGYRAAENLSGGANNLVIGYDVDLPDANGNGQLVIGNLIYGTAIDGVDTTVSSGNIGIGTSTPDQKLDVVGTIQASNLLGGATSLSTDVNGNIIRTPSDLNLKEDVRTIENALEKTLALRGVTYNWQDIQRFGNGTEIGFIAQEVDLIIPEAVQKGGEYWSLNTANVVAVVVEGMKELWEMVFTNQENITVLEEELKDSKSVVSELLLRIQALEQEVGAEPAEAEAVSASSEDEADAETETDVEPIPELTKDEDVTDTAVTTPQNIKSDQTAEVDDVTDVQASEDTPAPGEEAASQEILFEAPVTSVNVDEDNTDEQPIISDGQEVITN